MIILESKLETRKERNRCKAIRNKPHILLNVILFVSDTTMWISPVQPGTGGSQVSRGRHATPSPCPRLAGPSSR